ncbi:hypothetical protein L486_07622 [Kwoniella mangroviensis CBS 10435]|uniref:Peroxin-19 n=1 Tax=Kwoniella mangroviensis CBS 10435 TaxID=1331196 RepID=A0A1B9IH72_9TREE|nr:hypothetical protein L486_07622 [Kwoniella mangroviensis CBS 10435]
MPPPEQAESSKSYRNPTVEDDDDDDLDDLDDVLASFNTTSQQKNNILPTPPITTTSPPQTQNQETNDNDDNDDFEASLMEGMDELLKQLAGTHPPGPMLDVPPRASSSSAQSNGKSSSSTANGAGLSKEAEEEAWQKALEMVLSGEGLKAMGLDANQKSKTNGESSSQPQPQPQQPKASYEETLAKTLESLNKAGSKPNTNGNTQQQPDLSALLASLGGDPDLLKDLNLNLDEVEGKGDGDLADVLEGMMRQLMTKEVLEEPMNELASKYPTYLSSPPDGTTQDDLIKYRKQNEIVQKIVGTFKKPNYSDEKDGKEIAGLVSEMQDLGGPPKEIMGDLPEGFDLGALGSLSGEDGCTIM